MYEIYLITNQINEKRYVGQTVMGVRRRFLRHLRDADKCISPSPLYKSMRKYGPKNFTVCLLATASDKAELDELEKFWIKRLDTKVPNGYNVTEGGGGCFGLVQNEETRRKKSEALKGRFLGRNVGEDSPVFRRDLDEGYIVELYQQGKSSPQIARLLGTNSRTIQNRLESAGVPSRSISESQKLRFSDPENKPAYRKDLSTEDMISMFQKGLSPQKIAKELGCSHPCVIDRLKKVGVYRPSHRVKGLRLVWTHL